MEGASQLGILAEVGVGLAGFSGLMFAVQSRNQAHPWETYRVLGLLSTCFHVLLLALLPAVVHSFGVTGPTLWRASSGIALALTLPTPILIARAKPEDYAPRYYRLTTALSYTLGMVGYTGLAVNLFAIGTEGAFSLYLLTTSLHVPIAAVLFITGLLAPPQ